jgi:hypothetical protein
MNAIYCYKPVMVTTEDGDKKHIHYKPLNDDFYRLAKLSIKSVSKHYKTILYSDVDTANMFGEKGLIFDKVVILESLQNFKQHNYALPKIYTMIEQTEPYIMFDFDTIITEKLESTKSITYAYYEVDLTKKFNIGNFYWVENGYMKDFRNTLKQYYDSDFVSEMDWRRYPNFSTLMVKNPNIVKDCYNDMLKRVPLEVLDKLQPTLIEQFMLHQHVLHYGIDYGVFIKGSLEDYNKLKFNFNSKKILHISINEENFNEIFNILYQNLK